MIIKEKERNTTVSEFIQDHIYDHNLEDKGIYA